MSCQLNLSGELVLHKEHFTPLLPLLLLLLLPLLLAAAAAAAVGWCWLVLAVASAYCCSCCCCCCGCGCCCSCGYCCCCCGCCCCWLPQPFSPPHCYYPHAPHVYHIIQPIYACLPSSVLGKLAMDSLIRSLYRFVCIVCADKRLVGSQAWSVIWKGPQLHPLLGWPDQTCPVLPFEQKPFSTPI